MVNIKGECVDDKGLVLIIGSIIQCKTPRSSGGNGWVNVWMGGGKVGWVCGLVVVNLGECIDVCL